MTVDLLPILLLVLFALLMLAVVRAVNRLSRTDERANDE